MPCSAIEVPSDGKSLGQTGGIWTRRKQCDKALNSGLGKLGLRSGGAALFRAVAFCMTLPGMMAAVGAPARAVTVLENRKLPMHFTWVACEPNCRGWIGAVGIVTGETSKNFDEFAH